jgi:outer membrane receptor protein involved in Fe transport
MQFLRRCCTLGSPLLLCGVLAAQTNRGAISGTVFDTSGAVVADATVTIRNLGTNEVVEVKTSREGAYSALALDPVLYRVTVTAEGFKTTTIDRVKVDTAQNATVNVTLDVGGLVAEVSVQAAPPAVNLQSGTMGTTVTQRELTDIPLFNRSVLDLAITQPNITGDVGSEDPAITANATVPGYNLSLNGARPGSSVFLSDGVNNTGVSLARTMVSFSPETVQEFTVQTSAFSAEYGSTGGGIVNATTKSGTNQLVGTALWYNRNPSFASPAWVPDPATTKAPPSNIKYNQFSLTAGGPVVLPNFYDGRNRTFWFAAYEPRYRRDLCNTCTGTYDLLPTDAMRGGDFSNTVMVRQPTGGAIVRVPSAVAAQFGFVPGAGDANIYNHYALAVGNQFTLNPAPTGGNTYPAFTSNGVQNVIPQNLLDAAALKALAYIPRAGEYFLDPNGNIANVFNPRTLRQDETRYTVRVDHIFSVNDKINGRYTHQPTVKTQFTPADPTGASAEYSFSRQAMIDYTHVFTPRLFNDLRLNYTHGRFSTTVAPQFDVNTGQNLNTILGLPSLLHGGVPSLPFIGGQGSSSQDDTEERYGLSDILYLVRGNMSWKFGIDVSHSLQNETPLFDAIGGNYDIRSLQTNSNGSSNNGTGGDAFASFLLGVVQGATFRPSIQTYRYRWNALAAFAQNDWRIRPRLTLNLGLRYDLELPRTEAHDLQGVFRPDLQQSFPVPGGAVDVGGGVILPLASIQVPAYALAGKGGRSRYLYPPSYLNLEPRFGFAWSPGLLAPGGRQMTVRGGYGISHFQISGTARLPNPDFGFLTNYGGTPVNPAYVERLGENPPNVAPIDVNQGVFKNIPANGLLFLQPNGFSSLSMPGFAVSPNLQSPYSQNWNLTLSWEATPRTILEVSYLGNKGTHLFEGAENVNPRDLTLLNTLDAVGINTTGTGSGQGVVDPLLRRDAAGNVIKIQTGTLYSPYVGFPALYTLYDASGNSSRHAATVYVRQRFGMGVMITSNYTYGRSIDDSQGASDKFVLTTGQVAGQAAFGAPRSLDQSVSTFDQTHSFNTTFVYDLPFGREHRFLGNSRGLVGAAVGGWTTSGILRVTSGYPAWATLVDSNQLGDPANTHQIRPNIVPGVPLTNPLWSSSCPTGPRCQPFLNPEAFERPPLGQFGNAPRTFDSVRGPVEKYFDASIQKNFSFGGDGKRRFQLRVDLLNAFNIPVFRVGPNQTFTDFMSAPNAGTIIGAEFNTWARANSQPTLNLDANGRITDTAGQALAIYNGIVNMVNQNRNASGVLPNDFFTMPLPASFHDTPPNTFDIRTLTGYKLWRLRNAYNTGFGTLFQSGLPRYIQFGLKIYF